MANDTLLKIWNIQNYIRITCHRADMTAVFKDDIEAPYTKGKVMYIPTINARATESDLTKLIRYVNHEVSHLEYQTNAELMQKYNLDETDSPLGLLWRFYEDIRVDKEDYKDWAGDADNMELYYDSLGQSILDVLYRMKNDKELSDQQIDILSAMLVTDSLTRAEWLASSGGILKEAVEYLSPIAKEYLARFIEGDYHHKINEASGGKEGSQEVYDLSKDILKNVFELDPEEEQEKMEEEAKQKAEGEDGEQGEGQGEGASEDGSDSAQSELGDIDNGNPRMDDVITKYKESLTMTEQDGTSFANMHLDYTDYINSYDTFVPCPANEMKILNFESGKHQNIRHDDVWDHRWGETQEQRTLRIVEQLNSGGRGAGLANKVRKLLQIRSRTRYEYGQKKGKLHDSSLHRVLMKDAPGYNERVFKRRITNDTLDTAVSLLVDFSGSMGGSKVATAIHSSLLLQQALAQSLRIPLEVIGFSDSGPSSIMMVFKTFDKPVSIEGLQERMLKGTAYMRSNADGEAINWTHNRLVQRKEKRKVMIVLSDGSPACSRSGDIDAYTKNVVKAIEAGHRSEIVGIGIEDRNVERYYTSNFSINDADQLEEALLHVIERKML